MLEKKLESYNSKNLFVKISQIFIVFFVLFSTWVLSTAFADVPQAPTNLSGTPNGSRIVLSWSAPIDNGGVAITDYTVEFSSDNANWTTFNDGVNANTSATITGLNSSTSYSFRVSARNNDGLGAASSVISRNFCSDLNSMDGITGQILWLRADCVNGTPTQPNDNSEVTTWQDLSGNNNDATSNNDNRRPRFRSDSTFLINDQPVINFTRDTGAAGTAADTGGARFIVDNIDIRASVLPDVSVFVVYKPRRVDGDTNDILGVWGNDDGSWDRFFLAKFLQTGGSTLNDGLISLGPTSSNTTNSRVTNAGTNGVTRLLTAIYDGAVTAGTNTGPTDASKIYFGSTLIRSFTDSTHATAAKPDLYIGWDGDGSSFRGDIAEFIVFNRALESDLPTINQYLNDRYNLGIADISTNLPTVIHADPKSTAINFPPLTLTTSTNAMICFEQVSNSGGDALSGSANIAVSRTTSVSNVTETIGTNSWRYSGTRANVQSQINSIQITGTGSDPVANASSKWVRVRVTASRTNCATNPVSRVIEIRPLGLDGFRRVTVTIN